MQSPVLGKGEGFESCAGGGGSHAPKSFDPGWGCANGGKSKCNARRGGGGEGIRSRIHEYGMINTPNEYFFHISGTPKPTITWHRSGLPMAASAVTSAGSVVTSRVVLEDLGRSDSGALLTCQASNSNVSRPTRKSVSIVMNREY